MPLVFLASRETNAVGSVGARSASTPRNKALVYTVTLVEATQVGYTRVFSCNLPPARLAE